MPSLEAGLVAKEQNKFVLTVNGKTAVVVANDDGTIAGSGATMFIGTPTLYAVVNTSGSNSNTTLNPGPNQIGSVTISNIVSLASINGNVGLVASTNFIGLATVVPAYPFTTYTTFATIMSASGLATLFVPPASNRWVMKDLIIGAAGKTEVKIVSGVTDVIPHIGLATTGGYISNFGDSGFPAKALNDAFVVGLNNTATLSITTNIRFQSI